MGDKEEVAKAASLMEHKELEGTAETAAAVEQAAMVAMVGMAVTPATSTFITSRAGHFPTLTCQIQMPFPVVLVAIEALLVQVVAVAVVVPVARGILAGPADNKVIKGEMALMGLEDKLVRVVPFSMYRLRVL
jgi:hypothetical protein